MEKRRERCAVLRSAAWHISLVPCLGRGAGSCGGSAQKLCRISSSLETAHLRVARRRPLGSSFLLSLCSELLQLKPGGGYRRRLSCLERGVAGGAPFQKLQRRPLQSRHKPGLRISRVGGLGKRLFKSRRPWGVRCRHLLCSPRQCLFQLLKGLLQLAAPLDASLKHLCAPRQFL